MSARNGVAWVLWIVLAAPGARLGAAEIGGQVRGQFLDQQPNARGPLALANAWQPGTAPAPTDEPVLDTELRAHGGLWTAVATFEQQHPDGGPWSSQAWFNEAYVGGERAGWQFSAGRRIVSWDVGYGFRPNDIVQQEARRTLLSVTPEGRPMLMAERYDADSAWSLVWVNPQRARDARGAEEPALAARAYRRDGGVDWHGFARVGARTGASLGAAAAWVATDALELHGSVRWLQAADGLAIDPGANGPVSADPWQAATLHHVAQALVGATWTNADQFGLLGEAWWDGTALSTGQWTDWNARNRQLAAWTGGPVPRAALAGNLAWQGDAFNANASLQRANLYLRASWTPEHWQPAIDLLVQPADGGHVVTASLGWQGDRLRLDAVCRWYGGPSTAVLAQLPARRTASLAATWTF